jgi:tRNA threonylcarbamoyladenosine biosynthesis protein TsaB
LVVLGIETSTEVCAVGLANDDGVMTEGALIESHIHSEKLLTLISDILKQQQMSFHEIDAIAISIGPGSFTGLRIGLSTAKGLCFALGKPLVVVPTFEAMVMSAFAVHHEVNRVVVCLDAKQGDNYIVGYEKSGLGLVEWFPLSMVKISRADDLLAQNNLFIITDRKDAKNANVLSYAKGSMVAYCGIQRAHDKIFSDITSVEPMYLKDFVIKTQPMRQEE